MKNRVLLGALVLFAGAVVLVGAMGGTDDVVVAPVVPVETTTSTTTTYNYNHYNHDGASTTYGDTRLHR